MRAAPGQALGGRRAGDRRSGAGGSGAGPQGQDGQGQPRTRRAGQGHPRPKRAGQLLGPGEPEVRVARSPYRQADPTRDRPRGTEREANRLRGLRRRRHSR